MRLLLSHDCGSTGRLWEATWCESFQEVYASLQTMGMYSYTHCWTWQVESGSMPCSQNQYPAGQTQPSLAHDQQVTVHSSKSLHCRASGSGLFPHVLSVKGDGGHRGSKSTMTPRSRACQFGADFGTIGMVGVAAMLTRQKYYG